MHIIVNNSKVKIPKESLQLPRHDKKKNIVRRIKYNYCLGLIKINLQFLLKITFII